MLYKLNNLEKWKSWTLFVLWVILIYATIPVAREIQVFISGQWGRQFFFYAVAITVVLCLFCSFVYLIRIHRKALASNYAWIFITGAIYMYYSYQLSKGSPEEAVHFIQYGVLGVLGFRALSQSMRDSAIYVSAGLICALVGTSDEIIQWLTPKRYWDFRDVWINAVGGGLIQISIWKGFNPEFISLKWSKKSIKNVCHLSIVTILLLGCCASNTPTRVEWMMERFPSIRGLERNLNLMNEFGYMHADEKFGHFYSRFTISDLRIEDQKRFTEAATILDKYRNNSDYDTFLSKYTPVTDPFLHEARVHLFRRDEYLKKAIRENDTDQYLENLRIAWAENLLMKKYFSLTLRHSSYVLSSEISILFESLTNGKADYKSAVDRHLFTKITERNMWLIITISVVALALIPSILKRK